MSIYLTTREAAAVIGWTVKAIQQEYQRVLDEERRAKPARSGERRCLSVKDLTYLQVVRDVQYEGLRFNAGLKRDLYAFIKGVERKQTSRWSRIDKFLVLDGPTPLQLDITGVECMVRRLRDYRKGKRLIERRDDVMGGELVFAGTRIPVDHVVALFADGLSEAEIQEDYPTLPEAAIRFAQVKSRLGRPPGRPRKPLRVQTVPA